MKNSATVQKIFTQEEASALVKSTAPWPASALTNDSLFRDLEQRYGAVFAQWVIDRM